MLVSETSKVLLSYVPEGFREAVVRTVFESPHDHTRENVQKINAGTGQTVEEIIQSYIDADCLFLVETISRYPLYIIAVNPDGIAQTAMTSLFDEYAVDVSKVLSRGARTDIGKGFFYGTVVGCSWNGEYAQWMGFMGFRPWKKIIQAGEEMLVLKFNDTGKPEKFKWSDLSDWEVSHVQ